MYRYKSWRRPTTAGMTVIGYRYKSWRRPTIAGTSVIGYKFKAWREANYSRDVSNGV